MADDSHYLEKENTKLENPAVFLSIHQYFERFIELLIAPVACLPPTNVKWIASPIATCGYQAGILCYEGHWGEV